MVLDMGQPRADGVSWLGLLVEIPLNTSIL